MHLKQIYIQIILLVLISLLIACKSTKNSNYDSATNNISSFSMSSQDLKKELRQLANINLNENDNGFVSEKLKSILNNYRALKDKMAELEKTLNSLVKTKSDTINVQGAREQIKDATLNKKDPLFVKAKDSLSALMKIKKNTNDFENTQQKENNKNIKSLSHLKNKDALTDKDKTNNKKEGSLKKISTHTLLNKEKSIKTTVKEANALPKLYKQGLELFKKGDYHSAIAKFEQFRQDNPKSSLYLEATLHIGKIFKKLKMDLEAKVFFDELLHSYPDSLQAKEATKLIKN